MFYIEMGIIITFSGESLPLLRSGSVRKIKRYFVVYEKEAASKAAWCWEMAAML